MLNIAPMTAALLDLHYLPNVTWLKHFLSCDAIYIERQENMVKSTCRNRCEIAGAGGKLALTIPLIGGRDHHQLYRETEISYHKAWQHNHWQSILSAYGSAPFFGFYADRIRPFYEKEHELLFDFNAQLLAVVLKALKIDKPFEFTQVYEKKPAGKVDLRSTRQSAPLPQQRYYQVFEDRNGFISNLSVLDLLFHEGPAALSYLQR